MCHSYSRDMSVTNLCTTKLHDPVVPAVQVLLADGVPLPLITIFAEVGVTIEEAVVSQVTWWPGKSIVVRYRARCSGALHGEHQIVACAGNIPGGAAVVEGDGMRIGVWRFPHDPALPGLAAALDPRTASQVVHDLGMSDDRVCTRLRSYRPGRRAVVEVRGDRTWLYLKLVRPAEVEGLHRRHAGLPVEFPAPPSLGFDSGLGVLALKAMPGITLRQVLEDSEKVLPKPDDLEAILHNLPVPRGIELSPSPIEQLPALSKLLSLILPSEKGRIEELVGRIGGEILPPAVVVHGDFHESQLLVKQGRVVAVLDIDTLGQGRSADDPATMIGHLAVFQTSAVHPDRVRDYAASLLRRWDHTVDPVDLRRRAAAAIIALATGPFRVQRGNWPMEVRQRLDLAERWVDSIDLVDDGSLIPTSCLSHHSVPSLHLSNHG
jgi:hypothetical protein